MGAENSTAAFILQASMSLAMMAFAVVLLSMLFAFVLRWRELNEYYQHPLPKQRHFKSLPFSMQAGVYLDIFLRLMLPRKKTGMTGNANAMLAHIDPSQVPFGMRWPIVGFWGGMLLGLAAQLAFFVAMIYLANVG